MMSENVKNPYHTWLACLKCPMVAELSSSGTDITEVFTHLTRHFRIPWKNLSWLSLPNIRFFNVQSFRFGSGWFAPLGPLKLRPKCCFTMPCSLEQIHGPAASHKRRVRSIWHRRQALRSGTVQLCTPHLRAKLSSVRKLDGAELNGVWRPWKNGAGSCQLKIWHICTQDTGHDTSDYEILHYSYVGSSLQRQNILKLLCTLLQLYSIIFRRGTAPSLLDRQGIPPSK